MHMRVSLYELLLFPLVSAVSDVGSSDVSSDLIIYLVI
jgi:hypothetical protein